MNRVRKTAVLVIAVMLLFTSVAAMALQGGNITQYNTSYVTGTGSMPLLPDIITMAAGGEVAYALEPAKVSTRNDTIYEPYEETNESFRKGVGIIMQYGYPLNMGIEDEPLDDDAEIAEDKARYATAIALQAWAIHNGAEAPTGWTDFVSTPTALQPAEGCDNVVAYIRYLCDKASAQSEMPHSVTAVGANGTVFQEIRLHDSGGAFSVSFSVKAVNVNKGYVMDLTALPTGTKAEGYTGRDGDNVTLTLPKADEESYTLKLIGKDTRVATNYAAYTPTEQSDASKLVAMTMTIPYEAADVSTAEVTVSKNSGTEGSFAESVPQPTEAPTEPTASNTAGYPKIPGSITVYDKDTSKGLPGAIISIEDKAGTPVKKGTTDGAGCVGISELGSGTYKCTQTASTTDHVPDSATLKFAVIKTTDGVLYKGNSVFVNEAKKITLLLVNGEAPIPDVGISIVNEQKEPVATQRTDAEGRAVYTGIGNGTYNIYVEDVPMEMPDNQADAMDELTREINVTDAHDNNSAVYTLDIAPLLNGTGTAKPPVKTGEAEVKLATRMLFIASLTILLGAAVWKILNEDSEDDRY